MLQLKASDGPATFSIALVQHRFGLLRTFLCDLSTDGAFPKVSVVMWSPLIGPPQALGVDDVLGFPFIDSPPRGALVRSLELLFALEALDDKGKLTATGTAMARFPLEPMAAKALLAAEKERCAEDVIAVVAMLDTEGLFFNPKCVSFHSSSPGKSSSVFAPSSPALFPQSFLFA